MAQGGINIGSIYADLDVNSGRIPAGLAAGEQALGAFKARVLELDGLLRSGAIGGPQHAAQVAELNREITDLAARMATANAAVAGTAGAVDLLNAKMAHSTTGSKQLAISLMQLGYMADDLQYGFSAIVNNVAPLVHGFAAAAGASATMSAGIAAGAQLAAVAAIQLAHRWDDLLEALGDTSGSEAAMRSLDGMTERLKKLQEDAENFSWGEALSKGLAGALGMDYDPDAGKGQTARNLAEDVRDRKKDEAAGNKIDDFKTEEQKKEEARYEQAVGEAGKGEVFDKVARDLMRKKGAAAFLDPNKGKVRGMMEALGAPEGSDLGFVAPPSQVQEYGQLQDRQKAGTITGVELGRMKELEGLALDKALEEAKRVVGRGGRDRATRDVVAGIVGGDEGDVIAGRKDTKKDADALQDEADQWDRDLAEQKVKDAKARDAAWKADAASLKQAEDRERQNRQASASAWEKEARERQGQVREEAEKAVPGIKEQADRLAAREERQRKDPDATDVVDPVAELKKKILAGAPGLSDDEAEAAAREQIERTKKDDPEDRAARIKADNAKQLKKLDPDATRNAERTVAVTMAGGGDVARKFAADLKKRLMDERGMEEEDAAEAVKGLMDDASQKVGDRLRNVRGDKGGRPEASSSQTFASSDLSGRVQSAVSNQDDSPKRLVTLGEKQLEVLTKIAEKKTVEFEVD